jgi:hypothetical protein
MKLYMFRRVRLSIIRILFAVHSAVVYVIQICRQLSSRTRMKQYIINVVLNCCFFWTWNKEPGLLGRYSNLIAGWVRIETGVDFLQVPSTSVVSKSRTGFRTHQASCEKENVALLPNGKKVWGGGGAKHLSLSSIDVKITGRCISTLPYFFIEWSWINYRNPSFLHVCNLRVKNTTLVAEQVTLR